MLPEYFVVGGSALTIYGSGRYVYLTLKGEVQPNRVTAFLWALAPMVAFSAAIDKGVGLRSLMTFMVGFWPLMILIASFMNRRSYWRLKRFDYICGGLSLAGLAAWLVTGEGNLAILFAIAADGLAALPVVYKSYVAPDSEYWLAYGLAAFSGLITLLTIDNWSFANWGFPLYIMVGMGAIAFIIKTRIGEKFKHKKAYNK